MEKFFNFLQINKTCNWHQLRVQVCNGRLY